MASTARQNGESGGVARLRVVIQQPALAKYRVPVFREFAARAGIELLIAYADDGAVPNVSAESFGAEFVALKTWRGPGPRLFWHPAMLRYADKSRADVLVLTWNTRFLSLVPALRRARKRGLGTVLWGHGESKVERAWAARLRRWVARQADATLFYTRTMAERFVAAGGEAGSTFVAPNSIDQGPISAARDAFCADVEAGRRFRREQRLAVGRTVLFVSRLETQNHVPMLLEAAAALRGELAGLRVLIVGKGEDDQRLRALTASLGLDGVVTFFGPIYEEERLAPIFCCADVFCYPSNMGLSLLHAFGYGVPVVTGDNRSLHGPEIEALRHEENGLMFAHGDQGALNAALRRVLTDDGLRARLGAGAAATVAREYSIRNMVDGMEAAVRHAAARAMERASRRGR